MDKERILLDTGDWIAIYDGYPVSPGHTLLIPKGHYETYFDLPGRLKGTFNGVLNEIKSILDEKFHPDGYNIGMNCGAAAGQTIMHCHIHIIPRYEGDSDNPRGGVRGVIPSRMDY